MTTNTAQRWYITGEHEEWLFTGTYEQARMWTHRNARGATITPA